METGFPVETILWESEVRDEWNSNKIIWKTSTIVGEIWPPSNALWQILFPFSKKLAQVLTVGPQKHVVR